MSVGSVTGSRSTLVLLQSRLENSPVSSRTNAKPPVMPAAKLRPVRPRTTTETLGHVFAAVIANAFDHRGRAGIANRESLASHAVEERFAGCGAVEHNVADQDVFFRQERRRPRRIHDQFAAGKPLADVIVGIAFERQRDAVAREMLRSFARPSL